MMEFILILSNSSFTFTTSSTNTKGLSPPKVSITLSVLSFEITSFATNVVLSGKNQIVQM